MEELRLGAKGPPSELDCRFASSSPEQAARLSFGRVRLASFARRPDPSRVFSRLQTKAGLHSDHSAGRGLVGVD